MPKRFKYGSDGSRERLEPKPQAQRSREHRERARKRQDEINTKAALLEHLCWEIRKAADVGEVWAGRLVASTDELTIENVMEWVAMQAKSQRDATKASKRKPKKSAIA